MLRRKIRVTAVAVVTVLAVIFSDSYAALVARADEENHQLSELQAQERREALVALLQSGLPVSAAVARETLLGGEEAVKRFAEEGTKDDVLAEDLRELLTLLGQVVGEETNQEIARLISQGDVNSMVQFLEGGWQEFQAKDDRKTAWLATQAPEGSVEKQRAEEALRNGSSEAVQEFAAQGLYEAKAHDQRIRVWKLIQDGPPEVQSAATVAVQQGSQEAIEDFLRFGYPAALLHAEESLTMGQLVEEANVQSELAWEGASMAQQQAERAARAVEAARIATERARDEALRAQEAERRGAEAAEQAGRLAQRTGFLADQAVAAAREARSALQMTVSALMRAQAAATRAQQAASSAAYYASAAGRDASFAAQARQAAEAARSAQDAVKGAAYNMDLANQALNAARSAGQSAGSAAANADQAAGAASQAASAAGEAGQAAAEAQAGAAQAQAAAGRARSAANEIDHLVSQIAGLVEETKKAAEEAGIHAERAAEAAEEAARQAGNAEWFATVAGDYAAQADKAAERLDELVQLGQTTRDTAEAAYNGLVEAERDVQLARSEAARQQEEQKKGIEDEKKRKLDEVEQDIKRLRTGELKADDAQAVEIMVNAAEFGKPTMKEAAGVALSGGSEDIQKFIDEDLSDVYYQQRVGELASLMESAPEEDIRLKAEGMWYEDLETIEEFLDVEVPGLQIPRLRQEAFELRDRGGEEVRVAADQALVKGSFEELDGFINGGGFEEALRKDQLKNAYEVLDTGTPLVKVYAEAAIRGDSNALNRFYYVGRHEAQRLDDVHSSHVARMQANLDRMEAQAAKAHEDASRAQEAYQHARGSAEQARNYAHKAEEYAGVARQAYERAQEHVTTASQAYDVARGHQKRAHDAAAQAEADARQAASNADQAVAQKAVAEQAASQAAASAQEARGYALQAENDAAVAGEVAQEAYIFAQNLELEERQQAALAAAEEGDSTAEASVLEVVRNEIGPEALDLILELVGINDLRRCVGGDVGACLMSVVGLIPVGKIGNLLMKSSKIARAVSRLTSAAGRIASKWKESRIARAAAKHAKHSPACSVPIAQGSKEESVLKFEVVAKPGASLVEDRSGPPAWNSSFNIQLAADCIPATVVRTRKGHAVINGKYAGRHLVKVVPNWEPPHVGKLREVKTFYSKFGFPDVKDMIFRPEKHGVEAKNIVRIEPSKTRFTDNKRADELAGIDRAFRKKHNLVWHHTEEEGVLVLVHKEPHDAFRHTGGFYLWGGKYRRLPKEVQKKHQFDCPINPAGTFLGDAVRQLPRPTTLVACRSWNP
ncbi:hypothetical protein GSS88_06890 [Corynebacterium sp. 3HC-13]|uniref:HNH endonuclease n=1 Tax=Corynebacterium poyangense TaxID=2684405 RepID=UPI001CCAE14A|nr:HNH endonuclease [Corynebacterium poyangense]MBZ8177519.1 hypothetical protein [Corynebacterium poyangense]